MSLKNISIILCFIAIINYIQVEGFGTASDVQTSDNEGGIISDVDARISLILVDENSQQKSYRWGVTRNAPLKVVQGWYTFDDESIREHGGGGREIAETRPMQVTLEISKEDGFLVLNRGYEFSGNIGNRRAGIANKTMWPDGAELKSYYLSEPSELTDKLQPLWKGELIQDEIVVKSVIYAVRVVGEDAPNELFDARDSTEPLSIGRAWGPTPDPAKLIFEGKTIGQWIAQWDTRMYEDMTKATEMLTKIGKPAVPYMLDIIKQGGNNSGYARTVLGNMGPDAEEALDWLIETALDKSIPDSQSSTRRMTISCLGNMTWASERLLPVFTQIAQDTEEGTSIRQIALSGLSKIGEPKAMEVIEKIAESDSIEIRDSARGLMSQLVEKEGQMTREEFYTRLVENDPFDPSVPRYLGNTKGRFNFGRPHALTEKVKTLLRERLKNNPDPELAWNLVQIIQNGLGGTALKWAAPTDGAGSRSNREDPKENFSTLAEVLELGFEHSQPDSQLRERFGIGLAKLHLLQGDWDKMNVALEKLGQETIPPESRPWLPAPPTDWAVGLAPHWQVCEESMRTGDCSLEFSIEKEGKGLRGVHVLVKRAPEPRQVFSTGIAVDTLFLAPFPISDDTFRDSFGYRGSDREQTRYAISDDSGVVRFEKLPEIPVKIEVLVPTSNFPEYGTNWDLWMEVEPGRFKIAKPYGGSDAVSSREPPAIVTLVPGQTVHYPKLVVRPAFRLNIMDMDRVDKDNFVLSWQGLDPTLQQKLAHYELEMSLTYPSDSHGIQKQKIQTAKEILTDTQWPIGSQGVGAIHLESGNFYLFEVKALDKSGIVLARWPQTQVWVPWGYRRSNSPINERLANTKDMSPMYHEIWFRGTIGYGDGTEETLPERVERFLNEQPDAFEYEYARMGKAWLDWHTGDIEGARDKLEKLVEELPKGNLARGTAVSLLQMMDKKEAPPKRLYFVPDRE